MFTKAESQHTQLCAKNTRNIYRHFVGIVHCKYDIYRDNETGVRVCAYQTSLNQIEHDIYHLTLGERTKRPLYLIKP